MSVGRDTLSVLALLFYLAASTDVATLNSFVEETKKLSVELAAAAPTGPSDIIPFSNVTLVRDLEGGLSVFVAGNKILGAGNVQVTNGVLAFALPMTRVRLAESVPASPVYEYKDNVVPFNKLVAVDDTPSTDGDAA